MDCTFPSTLLRKERGRMVGIADKSNDVDVVRHCMEFVMHCDQLRISHEEITGCNCWYAQESNESTRDKRELLAGM